MLTFGLFKFCIEKTGSNDLHTIMLLEYIMEDTKCYIYNYLKATNPVYTDRFDTEFRINSVESLYEALVHYK